MLAVEVDLLTGRYTASAHDDRDQPEWPPHPARFFSALAAMWGDTDEPDDAEAAALTWLEQQDPPLLQASSDVALRVTNTHYVPVNDVAVVREHSSPYAKLVEAAERARAGGAPGVTALASQEERARTTSRSYTTKAGASGESLKLLPDERERQPRTYPTVRPADPRVHLIWPQADPDDGTRRALDGLVRRIWRLGHSSSLVACRLVDEAPEPTHEPAQRGEHLLRVPVEGLLEELRLEHQRHRGRQPRVLPAVTATYRAVRPDDAEDHPVPLLGGEWFVLVPREGPAVTPSNALEVARAVRLALLAHGGTPSPHVLSGHADSGAGAPGAASDRPHLAVVPLPWVGHPQADGDVRGIALALPRDVTGDERDAVVSALARWGGTEGRFEVRTSGGRRRLLVPVPRLSPPATATRARWARASTTWLTASPIALDRFPGELTSRDPAVAARAAAEAEETVALACERAGLPRPVEVDVSRAPLLSGSAPVRRFPAYRARAGTTRASVHARVFFARPVAGPLLLGAGRYFGRGLMAPVGDGSDG